MTKTICDKCGGEFREYEWQPVKFPSYKITAIENAVSPVRKIDLCYDCQQRFDDWLHNKEDATPGEDQPSKSCSYYAENDKKPCCIHDCNGCIWYV